MSATDLQAYVAAGSTDAAFVAQCYAEGDALVGQHIGTRTVPDAVKQRAILEVGSELFHRRQAPNGIAQFADFGGQAVRVARDPMVSAYPILAPFLGPVIA